MDFVQAGDNWNEILSIMNISEVANHAVSLHFLDNACIHILGHSLCEFGYFKYFIHLCFMFTNSSNLFQVLKY